MAYFREYFKEEIRNFCYQVKEKLNQAHKEGISRVVIAEFLHPLLKKEDGNPRYKSPKGVHDYIGRVSCGCSHGSPSSASYGKEENVRHIAYLLYAIGCSKKSSAFNLFARFDDRIEKCFPPADGISLDQIRNIRVQRKISPLEEIVQTQT